MEFRSYQNDNNDIVKQLFVKTFTDSEGKDEGVLIGTLVNDFLTNSTNKNLSNFTKTRKQKTSNYFKEQTNNVYRNCT